MNFKLILVPKTPDKFLLYAETPKSGLEFMQIAGQCLRRNLDLETSFRHITLGNLSSYEVSLPYSLAIASGWFDKSNVRYLTCEPGILEKYIFYGASMARYGNTKQIYPYYTNEVVLVSYIDELALLNVWAQRGYPEYFTINLDNGANIPLVPDADDETDPSVGDLVLDDLLQGVG